MQQSFESNSSLLSDLKKCTKHRNLKQGKALHCKAVESGSLRDIRVSSALITMYSRCGSLQDAQAVFHSIPHQNVVSWTALILGYVENGISLTALELFHRMDCAPDHVTLVSVLKACASLATENKSSRGSCLLHALRIHELAKTLGLDRHLLLSNTFLDVLCKCGDMSLALQKFWEIQNRDVVSWNILIFGYNNNEESWLALEVFFSMDCPPNALSFVAALKACAGLTDVHPMDKLQKGVLIHQRATELGLDEDILVSNTLIDMYCKCSDMMNARRVFDRMKKRSVVSWTVLISGYVMNGESLAALEVFGNMDCQPDRVTFLTALRACFDSSLCKITRLEIGTSIEKKAALLGLDRELTVGNTLLDMYRKCGDMTQARKIFDGMKSPDVVSWNTLLSGYVESGESLLALEVFTCMGCPPDSVTFVAVLKACTDLAGGSPHDRETYLQRGVEIHMLARETGADKDIFVGNTLLDMYSKCGDLKRAREVFEQLAEKDVVSWTAMMLGYLENGDSLASLKVFGNMSCMADGVIFAAGLKACGSLGALDIGQHIHARVCMVGLEQDEKVASSLIDFYGKCGEMVPAEGVFLSSRKASESTIVWTALIGGYTMLGEASQVLELAAVMEEAGVKLNDITLQLVLTACSHAGSVETCQSYLDRMLARYGVKPRMEHYACMVDTLGRANKLEEALSFVKGMPVPANSVVWTSLLGACKRWRNLEVGKAAFDSLIALEIT